MSKQSNKVEKRKRRHAYLKRRKTAAKSSVKAAPKVEADSGDTKVAASKKEAKGEKKAAAKPSKAGVRKKTEE